MIRTGQQYLAGLRDGREVYVDGQRVDDVTVTEGLSGMAHTVAAMYDRQHDPEYAPIFTMEGPDGDVRSLAWLRPQNVHDLQRRQLFTQTVARLSGGMFGRMPEYVPLFFLGMLDQRAAFSEGKQHYVDNIQRIYEHLASNDLTISHGFVDMQVDPAIDLDDTLIPRITRKDDDGIYVDGVKGIATFAPQSDEIMIGTFPRPGLKPHHVMYFSVPVATKGLRVVAREAYGLGNGFDHPVSRFGDENDAIVILDDVFVPWERVFQCECDPGFANRTFPLITEWAHWSILCRLAAKAEIMVGLFAALPEVLGRAQRPDAIEKLGEMERYLITLRSFIDAAAYRGQHTPGGHFMPDPGIVTAGRCYSVEHYPRLVDSLVQFSGQAFMVVPTKGTLDSPVVGGPVREMFTSNASSAEERVRLTRYAADLTSSSFGGRQTLFEIFNATGVATIRSQLMGRFELDPYKDIARATAGLGDLEAAERALRAHASSGFFAEPSKYDSVGGAYDSGRLGALRVDRDDNGDCARCNDDTRCRQPTGGHGCSRGCGPAATGSRQHSGHPGHGTRCRQASCSECHGSPECRSGGGPSGTGCEAGATGWLVKPFNPEKLLATIAKVI